MFWITGRKRASDSRAASNLVVVLLIKTVLWNKTPPVPESESRRDPPSDPKSSSPESTELKQPNTNWMCLLFLKLIAVVPWKWLWISWKPHRWRQNPFLGQQGRCKQIKNCLPSSFYPFRCSGISRFPRQFWRQDAPQLALAGYSESPVGDKKSVRPSPEPRFLAFCNRRQQSGSTLV